MTRLILLRHGETTSNVSGALDTHLPGALLTPRGEEQARLAGELMYRLAPRGVDSVSCSYAVRAGQTAVLATQRYLELCGSLGADGVVPGIATLRPQAVPEIHEVNVGSYEMRAGEEAQRAYAEALEGWLRGDPTARVGGGETYQHLVARMRAVLEERGMRGGTHVVVAHGGIIRVTATHATGTDPEWALAHRIPNCQAIALDTAGSEFGRWRVAYWAGCELLEG